MGGVRGLHKNRILLFGFAVAMLAVVAGLYVRATRPDEPLDRLVLSRVEDGAFIMQPQPGWPHEFTYMRVMKVRANTDQTRLAIGKAVSTNGLPATYRAAYSPVFSAPVGSFSVRLSGLDYEIDITPGGEGIYTQVTETRRATRFEMLQSSIDDFMDTNFGHAKA